MYKGCLVPWRTELSATTALVFFSSRRRHTRFDCDWSSDVCSSDLCPKPSSTATPPRCTRSRMAVARIARSFTCTRKCRLMRRRRSRRCARKSSRRRRRLEALAAPVVLLPRSVDRRAYLRSGAALMLLTYTVDASLGRPLVDSARLLEPRLDAAPAAAARRAGLARPGAGGVDRAVPVDRRGPGAAAGRGRPGAAPGGGAGCR